MAIKRETIWTIVAGMIFVGGLLILYFSLSYLTQENERREREIALAQQHVQLPVDPRFIARPNDDKPFEASAELIPNEGPVLSVNVQYDGTSTIRFSFKENDELVEVYLTPTENIYCQSGSCFGEDPTPDDGLLFDRSTFVYERGDVDDLARGLVRTGEEPCGDGICDIWTAPTPVDTDSPKVLIHQDTQNIMQVSGKQSNDFIAIDFTYKDEVKILLPLNVERARTDSGDHEHVDGDGHDL